MAFQVGDFVGVACEVKPGPFDDEKLIVVSTLDGVISGFVKATELRDSGGRWEVRAKVEQIGSASMKIRIYGSFFTTNGIANISSDLAMAA